VDFCDSVSAPVVQEDTMIASVRFRGCVPWKPTTRWRQWISHIRRIHFFISLNKLGDWSRRASQEPIEVSGECVWREGAI